MITNTEKIYNILSYILFIVSCIIVFMMLPFIFTAFANPVLLISMFVIACTIIYSFVSFKFNQVTVRKKLPSKGGSKALININGIISLFISFQILFSAYQVFSNSPTFIEQFDIYYNQLPSIENVTMPSKDLMLQAMKIMFAGMCLYAAILIIHVLISFSLVKKYKDYFTR